MGSTLRKRDENKMTEKFDISVIVTAHHEGRLAHRTVQSLYSSVKYAKEKGLATEIIVVLDRPDENTIGYFSQYGKPELIIKTVDFGDPGLSRNYGITASSGKYIAFLDADNLFGADWLYKAFIYLEDNRDKEIVAHPEYHIIFEAKNLVWRQLSSSDADCHLENLIEFNYWDTVCVARRDILLKYPYAITTQVSGFGFEDWHFNCDTLADGIEHNVVPMTVHFSRAKKTGSQNIFATQSNRLLRPTKLFEPEKFLHLLEKKYRKKAVVPDAKQPHRSVSLRHYFNILLNRLVLAVYNRLSFVLFPLFQSSPRLRNFVLFFWNTVNTTVGPTDRLPDWLIKEWKATHAIEPQLFPESLLVRTIPFYLVQESMIGGPYAELCRLCIGGFSHIFLVPWLKRGGADLVALNYINTLINNNPASRVLVLATLNAESPWAEKLPANTCFIEFGRKYSSLSSDEQEKLLSRLLLQVSPDVIHNINSELGYRIFVKYGEALRSISNLYASIFCKDVTWEGKAVGYPFSYLPDCFDFLTAVSSDNSSFLDSLQKIYAFDRLKMHTHYQPVQCSGKKSYKDISGKKTLDILWAGRMDRQKRPDILIKIAQACCDLPFKFHVYGSPLLDADLYFKKLKNLKNVHCYGDFDGFSSLPIDEYDIFLYTSEWDGLPTVLLGAMSACLPVIASDAGAICELISDKTGFLITPFDDVSAYVNCLKRIYDNSTSLSDIVNNACELVNYRHSPDFFLENLKKFPGYVYGKKSDADVRSGSNQ